MAEERPLIQIETDKGTLELELFEDEAPNTVANFITLAESRFYDGCSFHRVIDNFMIQGGCPHSKSGQGRPGTGGPGYCIPCEINPNPHKRGTLSMAHAGKDTGGSQFFICHRACPHLDGVHTVFGQVTKGLDVVDAIAGGDKIRAVKITRKRSHPYAVKKLPGR